MTNRSVLAGDGIAYAGYKLEGGGQGHPHACNDGVVYIGHLVDDDYEAEVVEAVPCRRCAEEAR